LNRLDGSSPVPGKKTWPGHLRRILYVILPVVILAMIFNRIDLPELKANIARTNPWLVALGIGYYPLAILVGATRWRMVVMRYLKHPLPWGFMIRNYWVGLALGIFAPSSVGWDAYRIVAVGRKFGQWGGNLAAILAEKLVALLNIVAMIILLFPLVKGRIVRDQALAESVYETAVLLLGLFLAGGVVLAVVRRHSLGRSLREKIERFLIARMDRISQVIKRPVELQEGAFSYASLVTPMAHPGSLFKVFLFSLLIQCLGAVHNQIFFQAVGYDIPLLVNLFLTPVFFLIFLLPISFGSLGIREGAYIVVYGLFGVPPETALLVSFLNLSGLLLNNLIGALLIWGGSDETKA